jgi:Gas vesicle protein
MSHPVPRDPDGALRAERIALVDLLDRVLAGGVVISGEIRLSVADVDLVQISLQALIASVSTGLGQLGD